MKTPITWIRMAAVPIFIFGLSAQVSAQNSSATPPKAASSAATPGINSGSAVKFRAARAGDLIGKKVRGAEDRNVGEINDLIVNVRTGDILYAMLEFDPGFFKSEKIFAVPLRELTMTSGDKPLVYKTKSREQLEKSGIDKAEWKRALENRRYLDGVDQNYGIKPPSGTARSMRASELIGKDVNSRSGDDIGDIKELVVDMGTSKVRYAVLAFDPSWTDREKVYAFPMTAFQLTADNDKLMLDVDRQMIERMKSFDPKQLRDLNALAGDQMINSPPTKR